MCKFFNLYEESLHLGVCKLAKYVRTALFSGKIYTSDKNFTRPPVATNSKSATPLQLSLDTYDYCIKMKDFHFDMYRCILRLSVKRRKMFSFVFYFFHNLIKVAPMS